MKKYKFDISSFKKLLKIVIDQNFSINLQESYHLLDDKTLVFDFADLGKKYFVELVPEKKQIDSKNINQKVSNQHELLTKLYPKERINHILVFNESMPDDFRKSYGSLLQSYSSVNQLIYDKEDIVNLAERQLIDLDNFIKITEKRNILQPDRFKSFKKKEAETPLKQNLNRKTILVGSTWDKEDQMERFINDSIWENGYNDRYIDIVNSVEVGDLLLLKSTYAKSNDSILRIKAYGKVISNALNGKSLNVKWTPLHNRLDISGLGHYRDTITLPNAVDKRIVLNELIINFPKFSQDFNSSNYTRIRRESISNTINQTDKYFDEKYKIHRFVRDVLNREHNLNFVIEETRIQNSFNLSLDLSDEEAKSYVTIINKDYIEFIAQQRGLNYDNILSKIALDITTDFSLLGSEISVNKYFAFLDGSFHNDDIALMKKELSNYVSDYLKIITLSDIEVLANKNGIKSTDYFNTESSSTNNEVNIKVNTSNDKIPFHLDNVETIDRLNREPVAKSLARLINNEIFSNKELNHSFMIHLQGEWGSGKSTFLNLLEKNLDTPDKKWIVIKYNAWQNQHILPPWWSFIDQIYRQAKPKFSYWFNRPGLKLRESLRRIIWYSGWHKIMTFVISIVFMGLLLAYGKSMITVISELQSIDNIDNKTKGLTLDVFAKLIVSIGSVIGLIFSLSKFLSTPFLMKSSGEAKSFLLRASDPMNRIKVHFNSLISNINDQGYQIAVFIDDIDRCNKSYTVSLLEGIQTLFKDKKVLYVVAGDKNWISTCFENNYKDFVSKISRNNEQLGDLFLEKAFQLSVRMPNVSERTKEKYWHHILGIEENALDIKTELDEKQKIELKQKIGRSIRDGSLSDPELLKNLEEEFNASEQAISDIAIETFDEKNDDIKHLFINHFALINPNPRAIKRLANNYTMYRNTLVAERKVFNPNKLFRWLILDDMYPIFSKKLLKLETDEEIEQAITDMNINIEAQNRLKILLFDADNKHGGKIEINDIKDILGL